MRNLSKVKIIMSSLSIFSIAAYAQNERSDNFTIDGTQTVTIPVEIPTNNEAAFDYESLTGVKTIQLLKVTPTQKMLEKNKNALAAGGEKDYSKGIIPFSQSQGAVDLGMANVPVLDQGAYGTCVTFAATAALDARLQKGDYIDQQCSLALNKTLGHNYWNGAYNAVEILSL